MRKIGLLILFLCLGIIIQAKGEGMKLGEIVITATRIKEPVKYVSASSEVITETQIHQEQILQVRDILQRRIGIDIGSNGNFGGATSLFLRGTNSNHTVIMIDGVKVYNPISITGTFDLANLTTDNIERIEIIRGPQSSLYGSDAIGGVINIITKKGRGKPVLNFTQEYGSHNSLIETLSSSGEIDKFSYSFSYRRFDTDGISKASKKYGNTEKDSYTDNSFSGKFEYQFSKDINIGLITRYTKASVDIDDWDFFVNNKAVDDPDHINKISQFLISTYFNQKVNTIWEHNLKLSFMRDILHDESGPNGPGLPYSSYLKGNNKAIDWQNNFYLNEADTLILGFQYNNEDGDYFYQDAWSTTKFKKGTNTRSFYFENKLNMQEKFFNILSLRFDNHSKFGTHTTYKIGMAYLFDSGTKLKGNFGTGFKSPTIFQLYAPPAWGGNPNLKPEKSNGYDIGVEQTLWNDKVSIECIFFKNNLKNLIVWSPVSGNTNIGKARTSGVETEIRFFPVPGFSLALSHTYLNAKDKTTGQILPRRARNKYNLNINYNFGKGNVNLNVGRYEKRYDMGFRLKDYTKLDLAISYQMNKNVELFIKGNNLLDRYYEEFYSYGTEGRSIYGGVKIGF